MGFDEISSNKILCYCHNLLCLIVTKNILLDRKKTLSMITLLDDMGAEITDNQTMVDIYFILSGIWNITFV